MMGGEYAEQAAAALKADEEGEAEGGEWTDLDS